MTLYRKARSLAGRIVRSIPWLRRQWLVSADYTLISEAEARHRRSGGWLSSLTVRRQERAYARLLRDMYAGAPRIDLGVAAEAVDAAGLTSASLLEVGCGSGYYSEVFTQLPKTKLAYSGTDYSPAMIRRALERYPSADFAIGDATQLAYGDHSFDIVFNGVSLMHILDYEKAIAESARIAQIACIFHSVPVFANHPTVYIHKYAYGSPVVEMVFSRDELLACFEKNGLSVVRSWNSIPYDVSALVNAPLHCETFLCDVQGKERAPYKCQFAAKTVTAKPCSDLSARETMSR